MFLFVQIDRVSWDWNRRSLKQIFGEILFITLLSYKNKFVFYNIKYMCFQRYKVIGSLIEAYNSLE